MNFNFDNINAHLYPGTPEEVIEQLTRFDAVIGAKVLTLIDREFCDMVRHKILREEDISEYDCLQLAQLIKRYGTPQTVRPTMYRCANNMNA